MDGFGTAADLKYSGMIVLGAPSSSDVIGPPVRGANTAEKPAGKTTTQNFRGNFQSGVVFVAELAPKMANVEEGLCHIVLGGQKHSRRGHFAHFGEGRNRRLTIGPRAEE